MTEKIQQSLRESSAARWTALFIVSLTMFGAYFFNYALSPVKPMLESMLSWNSAEFGIYTSSYGLLNVWLFMLIFSGIFLDKFGVRITGILSTLLMALGTGINYWALVTTFPEGAMIFGIKTQVFWSAAGFGVFGVGTEAAGITVSKAIVRWFKGKEMALAMGLQMSVARLGTALALGIALPLAKRYFVTTPVFVALVFMVIGFLAFLFYTVLDKRLDASEEHIEAEEEEPFKLKDILVIITNKGFWYIAILCVLFYSAVFPFLYYATDFMINKFRVGQDVAGLIPMLLPFGTLFLTPLFGGIYDKKGKGTTIMIIGSLLLIIVHLLFTVPLFNSWMFAVLLVIILGIGFSLVPAAMWPSVPKIIPEKQLGTAYAVIFWIQNIGLWGIPLVLGIVLNATNPEVVPNKTIINKSFEKAYISQLPSNTIELKEKDISKASDKASNMTVDSLLLTTEYVPVPVEQINVEKLKSDITMAVSNKLKNTTVKGKRDDVMKTLAKETSTVAYPIVEEQKLNIRYDYTITWLIFDVLAFLSLVFAFLLKAEDKKKGYGLEQPNIQK